MIFVSAGHNKDAQGERWVLCDSVYPFRDKQIVITVTTKKTKD